MVENKHVLKMIALVMVAAVAVCFTAILFSNKLLQLGGGTGVRMEYESKLFDKKEVLGIDIRMDEDEWKKMLSNATAEEYYVCDVTIAGKTFRNVGIRPKGNSSLSSIAMNPDTDRFSMKLEFDHFVKGQSCFGLDKLILNNSYADSTNMKEALVYDMYAYLGTDASLYNYAKISVNGEYFGLYLALEGVEESFMLRCFGTQDGELYKPDGMDLGEFQMPDFENFDFSQFAPEGFDFSNFDWGNFGGFGQGAPGGFGGMPGQDGQGAPGGFGGMPGQDGQGAPGGFGGMPGQDGQGALGGFGGMPGQDGQGAPGGFGGMPGQNDQGQTGGFGGWGNFGFDPENMPDFGGFDIAGAIWGVKGTNLNYADDDLDSYSTIWEGERTKTGMADHRRVVTAIKNINEGKDLEKYLDIDNILKYIAVHAFSVNLDSLSGNMAHNYYLYEYNGQLNIFPWDYNLSFGGMAMMGVAGFDNATTMINDAIDTPFDGTKFFDALLANETYCEKYHECMNELIEEYVNGGAFEAFYDRVRNQIDLLVKTDPTAFYDFEAYDAGAKMLYQTVKLRAESIRGQLDGVIPSTDEGQKADSSALVDASSIDIKTMGEFGMGDFGEAMGGPGMGGPEMGWPGGFGGNAEPAAGGIIEQNTAEGNSDENEQDMTMAFAGPPGNMFEGGMPGFGGFPGGREGNWDGFPGMNQGANEEQRKKKLILFGISFLVMLAALLFAKCWRRPKWTK